MNGYLSEQQYAQLLRPINAKRVSTDGKGFSHVEAYEIRAHLNRVFGFARWSADLTDLALIFHTEKEGKHTVCYRATVRLTVCAPDGTALATYTEAATGEAKNQPWPGDAHDLAIKTAESQAFKRCAVNIGDNYGLSLYAKGSTAALVKATLVPVVPESDEPQDAAAPVDSHITEPLPKESEQAELPVETRETNRPAPEPEAPAEPIVPADDPKPKIAADIRQRATLTPPDGESHHKYLTHLSGEALKARVFQETVEGHHGNPVTLKVFLEECLKNAQRPKGNAAADKAVAS